MVGSKPTPFTAISLTACSTNGILVQLLFPFIEYRVSRSSSGCARASSAARAHGEGRHRSWLTIPALHERRPQNMHRDEARTTTEIL